MQMRWIKKLVNHPLLKELDADKYFTYLRSVKKHWIIPGRKYSFPGRDGGMQQQCGVITGKMTVMVDDREYTLQQAAKIFRKARP